MSCHTGKLSFGLRDLINNDLILETAILSRLTLSKTSCTVQDVAVSELPQSYSYNVATGQIVRTFTVDVTSLIPVSERHQSGHHSHLSAITGTPSRAAGD